MRAREREPDRVSSSTREGCVSIVTISGCRDPDGCFESDAGCDPEAAPIYAHALVGRVAFPGQG